MERKIRAAILQTLEMRGSSKTCCPSEIARALDPEQWRKLMPQVREVADVLKKENRIEILQKKKIITSAVAAVGPIRLRLIG